MRRDFTVRSRAACRDCELHIYERVEKPHREFFHANWIGTGGCVSSSTYTV